MTFVSKRARTAGEGALEVTGDSTIRGTTHEVTLSVLTSAPRRTCAATPAWARRRDQDQAVGLRDDMEQGPRDRRGRRRRRRHDHAGSVAREGGVRLRARPWGGSSGSLARVRDLDLNDLRVFVRVVDRGGFAVAARELGVPTSTVSRTVARLEANTGTRLLHRTPRSVHATSEGRAIYASVSEAVGTLERAARALEPATRGPKGVLRVTAPVDIGGLVPRGRRRRLWRALSARAGRSLAHEPRREPRRRGVRRRRARGVATRRFVARREEARGVEHAVYASPRYIDGTVRRRRRAPRRSPVHRLPRQGPREGVDAPDDRETIEVHVRARMNGDDFSYVRAAALAGGGVALMPRLVCTKDEAAGRLVRVLPAFAPKGRGSTCCIRRRLTSLRASPRFATSSRRRSRPGGRRERRRLREIKYRHGPSPHRR